MEPQIPLSAELKAKVEQTAKTRGMSVSEFVRQARESAISHKDAEDPLFSDDAEYRDDGPRDLAANHDEYLYGDAS